MGATSVTGIGAGSVEGQNKGSKHMSLGTARLIGPRVVAAGTATLASGTVTIVLPALPATSGYVVLVTDQGGTAAAVAGAITTVAGTSTTLVLKGTGTNTVAWAIVKTGLNVG